MQPTVILLTLMLFSSNAHANCVTNMRGRVVCSNGEEAGGYNAKTGNAWKSEKNQNGVTTTQTSAGGIGQIGPDIPDFRRILASPFEWGGVATQLAGAKSSVFDSLDERQSHTRQQHQRPSV